MSKLKWPIIVAKDLILDLPLNLAMNRAEKEGGIHVVALNLLGTRLSLLLLLANHLKYMEKPYD